MSLHLIKKKKDFEDLRETMKSKLQNTSFIETSEMPEFIPCWCCSYITSGEKYKIHYEFIYKKDALKII